MWWCQTERKVGAGEGRGWGEGEGCRDTLTETDTNWQIQTQAQGDREMWHFCLLIVLEENCRSNKQLMWFTDWHWQILTAMLSNLRKSSAGAQFRSRQGQWSVNPRLTWCTPVLEFFLSYDRHHKENIGKKFTTKLTDCQTSRESCHCQGHNNVFLHEKKTKVLDLYERAITTYKDTNFAFCVKTYAAHNNLSMHFKITVVWKSKNGYVFMFVCLGFFFFSSSQQSRLLHAELRLKS